MADGSTFHFKISGPYTPATIPMSRLAEYMTDLAILLGETSNVHFVAVEDASVGLKTRVDAAARAKVRERVRGADIGDAPPDVLAAVRRTNDRLRVDNSEAVLSEGGDNVLIFPGRRTPEQQAMPAFSQDGSLDGIVIRLGGTKEFVPVHLESAGTIHSKCLAHRDLARRLASHLFIDELRVFGMGRWSMSADGVWALEKFTIHGFKVLDTTPLGATIESIRSVPENGWNESPDPWAELDALRNGPPSAH